MAIMNRLLQKPDMTMSEVVYEQYHLTLAKWHGFWASSAFNVSSGGGRGSRAAVTCGLADVEDSGSSDKAVATCVHRASSTSKQLTTRP